MIQRRTVLLGACGLVAAPALARAMTPARPVAAPAPKAPAVQFRIHGWDSGSIGETETYGETIVSFQLTNAWRAAWL